MEAQNYPKKIRRNHLETEIINIGIGAKIGSDWTRRTLRIIIAPKIKINWTDKANRLAR